MSRYDLQVASINKSQVDHRIRYFILYESVACEFVVSFWQTLQTSHRNSLPKLGEAPPPTGPKKPDIQPGPGRGQVAGGEDKGKTTQAIWKIWENEVKLT